MNNNFSNYSDKEAYRIAMLIAAYVRGTISKKEHDELDAWVAASDDNLRMFERLTDEKNLEEAVKWMETVQTEKALLDKTSHIPFTKPSPRRLWSRVMPYGIAASVIIIVGLFVLKPFSKKGSKDPGIVIANPADITPGGNKAYLTLADGRKIVLDSAANGVLASEGGVGISKVDGQIIYAGGQSELGITLYNTVNTPKGGQYRLTLSDGSNVWLNAASSIHYPVTFSGNERVVTILGEAYFEVAKNAAKPFRVKVNDAVVEVLGTHFAINAYPDEPIMRTILKKGSVKVSNNKKGAILKPGQEAQLNQQGDIAIVSANLDEALAWKNGKFLFDHAPIENIMRQAARWYDAEIVYENKPTDLFTAEVSRDVPVSKLLRYLELTNQVHFKIENKKIIVSK